MTHLGSVEGIGILRDSDDQIGQVRYKIDITQGRDYSVRKAIGIMSGESEEVHRFWSAMRECELLLDTGQAVRVSAIEEPKGPNQDRIKFSVNTPIEGYD